MQTLSTGDVHPHSPLPGLDSEAESLAELHRSWTQHVAAWQLAHEAAVEHATVMLVRIDALIAAIETR